MMLKQSLKSPENGDKLHQYIIVFNPPANWFSLKFTTYCHFFSFIYNWKQYMTERHLHGFFWLEDDIKQKGSISFWTGSCGGRLCPRATGSPCSGGWRVQGQLRVTPQASHSVASSLHRGTVSSEAPYRLLSSAVSLSRGSRLADGHTRQPRVWCWPVCILCTFSSQLGLPFKMADFLTGRDALSRAQAQSTQTGYNTGRTPSELELKNALFWLVFHLPFTGTWGVGGGRRGERLQARKSKDSILFYVKYIKIGLTKEKESRPRKIFLHNWGGKMKAVHSAYLYCFLSFQEMPLEGRQTDECPENKNQTWKVDCCCQNGETYCFGWPHSPHFF